MTYAEAKSLKKPGFHFMSLIILDRSSLALKVGSKLEAPRCLYDFCRQPIISVIRSANVMEVLIWVTKLSMWFQMVPSGVYEKQAQVVLQARLILKGKLLAKAEKLREIKELNYLFMVVMEEFANVIPMEVIQYVVKAKFCPN